MTFFEILKDDILQLNFHTFIGSWAQFEELHGPLVNKQMRLESKAIRLELQSCPHLDDDVFLISTILYYNQTPSIIGNNPSCRIGFVIY